MTSAELSEFIGNPPAGAITVSMSKHGIFLKTENLSREITSKQAEILFEAMPLMMQLRNLPATDGRKATDPQGETGDSGSDQGKQEGAVVDRCSRARPRPHPFGKPQ